MAYIFPGYRRVARGSIEIWRPHPPDPRASIFVFRRIGPHIYQREVGPRGTLDIQEAAVALNGADRTTVYRLIDSKHLRALNRGGKVLIPRQDIERYLALVSGQRRGRRLGEGWGGG